jgi:methyl-accepting chemotaxis protein
MKMTTTHTLAGFLIGLGLPFIGTVIEAQSRYSGVSLRTLGLAQASPLMWLIDLAPFMIGGFAYLSSSQQAAAQGSRRASTLQTARELFTAAQRLLASVSAFSSMTAETAASVRETTATMSQLGQTATQAAITAETVIGRAQHENRKADEGMAVVETNSAEMLRLAGNVRELSGSIEELNNRMRDVLEIASVVNYIADRSQRLSDQAGAEIQKLGGGSDGLALVVSEMRRHADDSKKAAAQVKSALGDVHKTMLGTMAAAQVGVQRAEKGAQAATSTTETIRRLAEALRESSQAAKDIASVAQQQDHGIEQVLRAMNEIFIATQETMASTQKVAKEARALNDLAAGLRNTVEG